MNLYTFFFFMGLYLRHTLIIKAYIFVPQIKRNRRRLENEQFSKFRRKKQKSLKPKPPGFSRRRNMHWKP